MNQLELANMVKTLESMAQLELVIADFYKVCGEAWDSEAETWQAIAEAEVQHARNIEAMIRLLKSNPDAFAVGRPISPAAVNTAVTGVKNNITKMKKGDLSRKQALYILRDIEQSLLESKYGEMIKTQEMEFKMLVKEIIKQTEGHQKMLGKKIEAASAGA